MSNKNNQKSENLPLLNTRDEIRTAILSADDLPIQVVPVPEWGLSVRVRGMTGKQVNAWQSSLFEVKGDTVKMRMQNASAKLVAMCVVDENGKRVFNDGADVFDLGDKSHAGINRVYEVARDLSGISKEAIEEIEKNFPKIPEGDSISD